MTPGITFFLDRCLGGGPLVEVLRQAGHNVELHDTHFAQDATDGEWLPEVGRRGWVALTKDKKVLTRPAELIAILAANTHVVVLKQTTVALGRQAIANAFESALTTLERVVANRQPPVVVTINPSGKVLRIEGWEQLVEKLPLT